MNSARPSRLALSTALLGLTIFAPLHAEDWPSWLGAEMDATWRETGVLTDFSTALPKVLWRTPADLGYAGPAVAEGRVYLFDYVRASGEITNHPSGKDQLTGQERIRCLDAATGEVLWTHAYDQNYFLSYPGGPRCTPTVAHGKVYTLGAEGILTCLSADAGDVLWSKDFKSDFEAETPVWGHAAHPLIHGDTLYCVAGGEGSVAVAFDAATGAEKWRALSATEPGYCPPSIIEQGGTEQLLIWHSDSLNALAPSTGEVLWSLPLKPSFGMALMAPRRSGDLLFASAIGRVGALMKLNPDKPGAEFLWRSGPKDGVYCANSTPFILGDTIYGCDIDTSSLMAVDLETGDRLWTTTAPTLAPDAPDGSRHGTAFITYHEPSGRFFLVSETGDLIIASLTREGYEEHGRFHALEPSNTAFGRPVVWSSPAFADRSVFLRNDQEIIRVDLSSQP